MHEDKPTTWCHEAKLIWSKIWQWWKKKHNRKAEWINNIKKKLQRRKNGPEAITDLELVKTTLKNVAN